MPRAIVGVGGNLGARRAIFACAEALLVAHPGCRLLARSKLYATPPLGPPQPDYLNGAFALAWQGDAHALLEVLRHVEQVLGRTRRERWGPRSIDLDLLHFAGPAIDTPGLVVPHPELERRTFALAPLLDVAPDLAARYAPGLAMLGGPPPVADPEWLQPSAGWQGLAISAAQDREQLAWLLVSTVAQCGELA